MTSREIVAAAAFVEMPTALATAVLVLPGCARSTSITRSWVWPGRARAACFAGRDAAAPRAAGGLGAAVCAGRGPGASAARGDAGEGLGGAQEALVFIDARPQDGEPLVQLCTNPFK